MTLYKNLGGNSNIYAFLIGADYIDVQFNGEKYIDILITVQAR